MVEEDKWNYFQENRDIPEKHKMISCYAAFNHMRINRTGRMSPCCFATRNRKWEKGKYGLKDYWFGHLNKTYQESFLSDELYEGCGPCINAINQKLPPPIYEADWNVSHERLLHALDPDSWPKVFEFEISNLCNFECPMCMGELSSKHMLGRDKDLKVYDPNTFDDDENLNELIEQFKEFIPHLDTIRFTGGEPFAHKALYRIADLVAEIKPDLILDITTNCSVFNKKVEKILNQNKVKLSLSIDTVVPEEYNIIRVGGNYDETFSNIQKFKKNGAEIKINSALMSVNALNINKFFEFGVENDFSIYINQYSRAGRVNGPDWNLYNLHPDVIEESIQKLKKVNYKRPRQKIAIDKAISLLENGKRIL